MFNVTIQAPQNIKYRDMPKELSLMAERKIYRPRLGRSRLGRPPLPRRLRRDQVFRAFFSIRDGSDIRMIAEGWGCPPGVVVWALCRSELARIRRRTKVDLGKLGLAIAGALQVLRQKWAEERGAAKGGSSEAG